MIARIRAATGSMFILLALAVVFLPLRAGAQDSQAPAPQAQQEKRIALVIGNSAYPDSALPTAANDAGLVAQTLQAAGFDVVGARDLDQDALRHAFRDFLDKAGQAGPDAVAFVYLAGYGVQLEGQNYFVPVDARLATPASIPSEAVRLSDLTQPLAGLKLKANVVVVDAARANRFAQGDQPLAGGLALVEANPNSLIAFNAAPGTVAPEEKGPYGAYAQALVETMRVGGLPVADVFDRVRLRVNEQTQGGQLPWSASRLDEPFVFFDRGQGAPAPQATYYQDKAMQTKAIADFDPGDAYSAAVARDTLPAYQDFITAYPRDPMAKRVRAIIAARREAITWRETWSRDTPNAYWSYLRRYPRGPHAWDARRRLDYLSAEAQPPASFDAIDYDVPPPPEEEIVYVDRPVFVFSDPEFDLPPPPPPRVIFLPPPPRDFVVLAPPPPPRDPYMLPTPPFVAVPEWVRPPRYVEPPPQNFIFDNIHDARVINERIDEPPPAAMTPGTRTGAAVAAGAAAAAVALPFFLRDRADRQRRGQPGADAPPVLPGATPQPGGRQPAQILPGMNGQPLPANNGRQPLPGQFPRNRNQPSGAQPGPQNQILPGQAGQDVQPGQPGQKGNRRGQGNAPSGQPVPNAQQDQNQPGASPATPGQGRRRLPGQRQPLPNAQQEQTAPGASPATPGQGRRRLPGGQTPPDANDAGQPPQGGQGQPGGRRLRQQGQPQAQPDANQQVLPRNRRTNPQVPADDSQPQGDNPPRLNRQQGGQQPRMRFQPPAGDQAPRQQMQPRQQPQVQPRQQQERPAPQMRPQPQQRPEPQQAPRGGGRGCGRPGQPPC